MAEVKWYGDKANQVALQAAIRVIQICAADLQQKSTDQAPVDTGDLRSNCSVSPIMMEADGPTIRVGYDLPYARRQHEHVEYSHPLGGKAKYLEDPCKANTSRYRTAIGQAVKEALGRG